jgi:hypothetical protein
MFCQRYANDGPEPNRTSVSVSVFGLFSGARSYERSIKSRRDVLLTQSHGVTENQVMSGERLFGVSISVLTRNDGPYLGGKNASIGHPASKAKR